MVAKDGQETSRNPGKQNFQLFNFTSPPDRCLKNSRDRKQRTAKDTATRTRLVKLVKRLRIVVLGKDVPCGYETYVYICSRSPKSCGKRPICRCFTIFMMIHPFWTVIFQFAILNSPQAISNRKKHNRCQGSDRIFPVSAEKAVLISRKRHDEWKEFSIVPMNTVLRGNWSCIGRFDLKKKGCSNHPPTILHVCTQQFTCGRNDTSWFITFWLEILQNQLTSRSLDMRIGQYPKATKLGRWTSESTSVNIYTWDLFMTGVWGFD